MKNLLYMCLTFLLSANLISAQTAGIPQMSKFTLQFEAASIALISSLSINVEGKFFSSDSEKIHLYGRAGIEYVDVIGLILCDGQESLGGNLGITMLTGKGNHHFEVFGGVFLGSFQNKKDPDISGACSSLGFQAIPLVDLGYRYQRPESGFFFRAKVGILGVGIGLGHAF